jgi:glycosyltransferase involved in cell wall biosynthesis
MIGAGFTLIAFIVSFYEGCNLQPLNQRNDPEPEEWPTLSVVVPACNEGETIEAALCSLMKSDCPALEIIAINDRSTDETGAILDRLAETNPILRVIHNHELPEGWLGKLHAMHLGTEASQSDLILYCDADVHFKESSLKNAVGWMVQEELDHLSLLPRFVSRSWMVLAMIMNLGSFWLLSTRPSRINRDKRNCYGGAGTFNMVRRKALQETEGWPWLKLEIADDIGLAYLLHRHGFKSRLGSGIEDLEIEWYASMGDLIRGLEKNAFSAGARFSVLRATLMCGFLWFGFLCPWLLLATPYYAVGLGVLLSYLAAAFVGPEFGLSWHHKAMSTQLGSLFALIIFRSMLKTMARGSVDWRGTTYPIAELRREQRVKL